MVYNVYLSGGGVKGAFAYGFFKELLRVRPDFPIRRIYAVSIGSINALPIAANRMDILAKYWEDEEGRHPFDLMVNTWDGDNHHVFNFLDKGSLFKSLKEEPFRELFNEVDVTMFRNKLIVISYDKVKDKTVFTRCTSEEKILHAIKSSSRYPGLFHSQDEDIIDGTFAVWNQVLRKKEGDKWLVIDLQNTMKLYPMDEFNDVKVYSPRISRLPIVNEVTCLFTNRRLLNHLIRNGEDDARKFITQSLIH